MAKNIFAENSFKDYYRAENSDEEENNNELLSQLYADIYYPSNNEIDLGAEVLSNAVPFYNCNINKAINEQESSCYTLDDKVVPELQVIEEQEKPDGVQTKENSLDQEINNAAEEKIKKKQKFPKVSKDWEKPQEENIIVIDELNMETKYNVVQKNMKSEIVLIDNDDEETSEDSDSVFEVPLSPKPKPILINLQESDNEDAGSSIDEDDLLEGRLHDKTRHKIDSKVSDQRESSPEVEIIEVSVARSPNRQDVAIKSKGAKKILQNNVLVRTNKKDTRVHEDILLNCTMIQKGARNLDEIKRLSKSADHNKLNMLVEENSPKKRLLQETLKGNSVGSPSTSQESCRATQETEVETEEERTKIIGQKFNINNHNKTHNIVHNSKNSAQNLESTSSKVPDNIANPVSPVTSRKRHSGNIESEETNSESQPQKRRCIVQQTSQLNAVPTPQSSGNRVKRTRSFWTQYFFEPLSEELKKFYNDSRGQEDFDVHELQRDMSKDPKMWAILDEDLMPSPPVKRRYWDPVKCTVCHKNDHVRKNCPERFKEQFKERCCTMCGLRGHATWRCPEQLCLTCGKKQNTFRKTCEHCRTLFCTMCRSVGHTNEQCPDLWRRYHQVTKEIDGAPRDPGNTMKPAAHLYCCNCTKRGHESSTCQEFRWSTHFQTPSFVTNYTEGPVYNLKINVNTSMDTPTTSGSSCNQKSKTQNLQIHRSTPATTQAESLPANTSSSLANAEINMDWETYMIENAENQVMKISQTAKLTFVTTIYCCGNFRTKDTCNARLLVNNLSQHTKLSLEAKKFLQSKFSNGTVFPLFLRKLRKITEFELIIGMLADRSQVMVQIIAPKDCIYQLFGLLLLWLNLPLDEKNCVDTNLPIRTKKMRTFFMNLKPPTCSQIKNPLKLLNVVLNFKHKLQKMLKNKEYFQIEANMKEMQIKLLQYINIYPKQSIYLRKLMSSMDMLKNNRTTTEQINAATYLDILLSYNNIYTPHTPPNLRDTLKYIINREKASVVQNQLHSNVENISVSIRTPQEINTIVNPLVAVNNQSTEYDIPHFYERGNVIHDLGTSNIVRNHMPNPQNILPFSDDLIIFEPSNLEEENNQKSTWKINSMNPLITEPSALSKKKNKRNEKPLTKKQLKQLKSKLNPEEKKLLETRELYKKANLIVNEALKFEFPYIVKAAEKLRTKIKNNKINSSDIKIVRRMINMEQYVAKYRRHGLNRIKATTRHLN